jgi:hypothetical protein
MRIEEPVDYFPSANEARFWMVWSPQGRAPTHKHYSKESAETEAKRLAGIHAGSQFFVLKAVSGVTAESVLHSIELHKVDDAAAADLAIPF